VELWNSAPLLRLVKHTRRGDRVMDSAKHYRDYAEDCLNWAKTAKSDQERETFERMAQTWLEAAMRAESQPDLNRIALK
jgi:hypothetical protein